jgi:allantoinase
VHFNEPGRTDWEGWATGTRALAAGGATACIEMPLNAHPPTIDGAAFDAKVAAASAVARVDFALWGGLVPGNLDRLDELAERGVVGFKAFMCDSGIEDFPAVDDEVLEAGMRRAAALGLPVLVHAERPSALRQPDGTTWRDFVASRPVEAELQAIEVALELAERTGCSLHVVHVSSGAGVALVAAGEATCETCPHYLTLTEDDLETLGARAKCAPPLRPAAERDALWEHLVAGRIAFVTSDHSPCPPELKAGDFTAAWGGIAGCQSLLGLLLDAGRLPLGQVAALTSANVAKRFNLPKGRLEPGADADLVLVDLRERHAPDLQDRHKLSPYAGRPLPRIVRTWVRGGAREGRLVTPRKDPA